MELLLIIGPALGTGLISGILGFYLRNALVTKSQKAAFSASQDQLRIAEERSKEILIEAKEKGLQLRTDTEKELRSERKNLQNSQRKLDFSQTELEGKITEIKSKEDQLVIELEKSKEQKKELETLKDKEIQQIEKISDISLNDAKEILFKRAEEDITFDISKRYRNAEIEMKEKIDSEARNVISGAIQKLASEVVGEETVSSVSLPNEEMKGRLIGRDGRNIRAIEAATGVDLIVDEGPESVGVSCFDPIRRAIAVTSLENLISDGRIQPARIEDIVEKSKKEVSRIVKRAGENAIFETSIKSIHPDLVPMMGRLKYRYSYGENVLQHSIETSHLASAMAHELGAKVEVCRIGGFLHDIGKAFTHEIDGPHAEIGADIVKKYNIGNDIETVIREHHDSEMTTTESFIVAAADAVSAARPGARRDTLEAYTKRLKEIEDVGNSFAGVERCYAIQAGRELRVLVNPEEIDDVKSASIARDIVKRIEEKLSYPGQIKVVVIRESRSIEFAQ